MKSESWIPVSEQLPDKKMNDLISRQAAIDFIDAGHLCNPNEPRWSDNEVVNFLKKRPAADVQEMRWIPVSEKLPEDIKPVIVTWKNNDPKSYYQYIVGKHYIGTAHYKNGKWYWYSSVTEDLLAEYGKCEAEEFDEAIEVVAWMPLPEPYKEERDLCC